MFLLNSCDAVGKSYFLVVWQASCPYQQSCLWKACRESVHDHAKCCSVPCLFFALASWICRGHAGGLRSSYTVMCIHITFKFMHGRKHRRIIVSLLTLPPKEQWLFALIKSGSKLWANSWLLYHRLPNLDSSQSFLGNSVLRCPGTTLGTTWPTGRA